MGDPAMTRPERTVEPQEVGARVARMYARHGRTLYGLCRMLLRDPHEAEDALQSTFLSAHRALLRGGTPRNEAGWLVAIARNECRGRVRARMGEPVHDDVTQLERLPDPGPTPEEQLSDPSVRRALDALPEAQREAVVLHDVLGLRSREVGRALGLSVPAVEALLFRARRQLRLRLRPVGTLVVPAAIGYALAEAIPGFVAPAAAGVAGGAGAAAGAGLLAKLAGAPAAAKVAAGVAAAATVGSVAAVEATRRPASPGPEPAATSPVGTTSPGPVAAGAAGTAANHHSSSDPVRDERERDDHDRHDSSRDDEETDDEHRRSGGADDDDEHDSSRDNEEADDKHRGSDSPDDDEVSRSRAESDDDSSSRKRENGPGTSGTDDREGAARISTGEADDDAPDSDAHGSRADDPAESDEPSAELSGEDEEPDGG